MQLEHVALNVPDPVAAARWYTQNLGMSVKRHFGPPAYGQFLADSAGQMMLEFYKHPTVAVPDYFSVHPQVLHLAFRSTEVATQRALLLQGGATAEGDVTTNEDGDVLAMLRDPWGVPVQLVKRARPML